MSTKRERERLHNELKTLDLYSYRLHDLSLIAFQYELYLIIHILVYKYIYIVYISIYIYI